MLEETKVHSFSQPGGGSLFVEENFRVWESFLGESELSVRVQAEKFGLNAGRRHLFLLLNCSHQLRKLVLRKRIFEAGEDFQKFTVPRKLNFVGQRVSLFPFPPRKKAVQRDWGLNSEGLIFSELGQSAVQRHLEVVVLYGSQELPQGLVYAIQTQLRVERPIGRPEAVLDGVCHVLGFVPAALGNHFFKENFEVPQVVLQGLSCGLAVRLRFWELLVENRRETRQVVLKNGSDLLVLKFLVFGSGAQGAALMGRAALAAGSVVSGAATPRRFVLVLSWAPKWVFGVQFFLVLGEALVCVFEEQLVFRFVQTLFRFRKSVVEAKFEPPALILEIKRGGRLRAGISARGGDLGHENFLLPLRKRLQEPVLLIVEHATGPLCPVFQNRAGSGTGTIFRRLIFRRRWGCSHCAA